MKGKNSNLQLILILGILVVFLLAILFFVLTGENSKSSDKFTAVFMESGQVYFGKVEKEDSNYISIKQVYYLQFSDNIAGSDLNSSDNNFTLIKRGNELHGPEDVMKINKDYIIFTEDLRSDSKVLGVISSK
jgi:hypothetical protein